MSDQSTHSGSLFTAPEVLRSLFSDDVWLSAAPVADYCNQLLPAELDLLSRAVDKRRREFSTGRMLARQALSHFDYRDFALLRGEYNQPLWPSGLCGSISHSSSWCVLLLAQTSRYRGIGIDIEHDDAKVGNLESMILRQDERDQTVQISDSNALEVLRLTFSAKEAVYKAVFYELGRFVDFDEVRLEFSQDGLSFIANAPDDPHLDSLLHHGAGHSCALNGHIVTAFIRRQ
ncbi:MAG: 4'-phosphopantetheinyl transferase superfamily protein [Pseudomonadota bacterium]